MISHDEGASDCLQERTLERTNYPAGLQAGKCLCRQPTRVYGETSSHDYLQQRPPGRDRYR